jgi:DNA-binding transcriptional LysR family regulator
METIWMEYYIQLLSFYYVAKLMSFTKAAAHLKCSKAHVSKQITNLERYVGTPLLNRNTRMVKLTSAGEVIFQHAQQMANELQSADNTIHALQNKVHGTLRITTPKGYADHFLAPNLHFFLNQYPDISIDMYHTEEYLNFIKEKIDLAIRITHTPNSDKVAKHLDYDRTILCASNTYLQQNGTPTTPKELSNHVCLDYTGKNTRQWDFLIKNEKISVSVNTRISSNSQQVVLSAALNHLGIAKLPLFVVQEYINSRALSFVLSAYGLPDTPIYAIFQTSRIISPKIHALIGFLEKIHSGEFR